MRRDPWKPLLCDEDAVTATEYAIMLALILIAAIGAVTIFGNSASGLWANNVNSIGQAVSPSGS